MTLAQRTFAEIEIRRARRTDPDTSKEAAAQAHGLGAEHCLLILQVLRDHDGVLSPLEIAGRCGLTRLQVTRRLNELYRDALARPTQNRRPTETGRMSLCWEAVRG